MRVTPAVVASSLRSGSDCGPGRSAGRPVPQPVTPASIAGGVDGPRSAGRATSPAATSSSAAPATSAGACIETFVTIVLKRVTTGDDAPPGSAGGADPATSAAGGGTRDAT